ncbi:MAG: SMI1/KNR4 family protein [Desulfobacterales bacterium]|nr:SMI1/KNR4 family protein [Desulfobacterales bacterium]
MRDLSEINISKSKLCPSKKEIEAYEKKFKVKIPIEYINFLNFSNGGFPELDSFIPEGQNENNKWSVDHFYFLNNKKSEFHNIWKITKEWYKHIGKYSIPIASDGGDNQIYIDTKQDNAIFLCIHDENFKKIKVAKSLKGFLDLLEEDPEMI